MIEDYQKFAEESVASQYALSTNFKGFLKALAKEADNLGDEVYEVKWNRYLDVAKGRQLDILGEILGIKRVTVDFIESIYFGFDPDPTALGFGDINNPGVGGRYRSAQEAPDNIRRLNDDEYRALLKAKIAKNSTSITPNEVLRIVKSILAVIIPGGEEIPVHITETGNASFETYIDANLEAADKALLLALDMIPRPAGVRNTTIYPP